MTEWRTLPEFPDYQITEDGDVRNKWSFETVNETQNKNTGAWSYPLRRANGKSTHRAYWGLIYSAFPELKPEEAPKPKKSTRSYSKRNQWRDIPDFPRYQIHPDGIVRYKVSKRFRKSNTDHVEYVLLRNDEGEHRRTINGLLNEVFPAAKEAVAE
jgi:hypothetical protein